MAWIKPFLGLTPRVDRVCELIAPPYDVITREEAKQFVENKPLNFLHVSKAEIDLADNVNATDSQVYRQAHENWRKICEHDVLTQATSPSYYIYQMQNGAHVQTGIVCTIHANAYSENWLRRHEHTRVNKEQDRIDLLQSIKAQISPVLLTYRYTESLQQFMQGIIDEPPALDTSLNDVQHRLWLVESPKNIAILTEYLNQLPAIYVADGHHRIAAAARIAEEATDEEGMQNYILGVLFPDQELDILSYHRVLKDIEPFSAKQWLALIEKHFTVKEIADPYIPKQVECVLMYVKQQWYRIMLKPSQEDSPLANLAVTLLHKQLIEPSLDLTDPRNDPRIDFIGGPNSLERIVSHVDSGRAQVGLLVAPTTCKDLLRIADAGLTMPPKSTWFEPKLADGLVAFNF